MIDTATAEQLTEDFARAYTLQDPRETRTPDDLVDTDPVRTLRLAPATRYSAVRAAARGAAAGLAELRLSPDNVTAMAHRIAASTPKSIDPYMVLAAGTILSAHLTAHHTARPVPGHEHLGLDTQTLARIDARPGPEIRALTSTIIHLGWAVKDNATA